MDVGLKVLIVESANDVAVMLAEGVAGSEEAFVARMNEAAQRLGMTRTSFANPNGLPDDRQVTTARDLAKLTRAIIIEFWGRCGLTIISKPWVISRMSVMRPKTHAQGRAIASNIAKLPTLLRRKPD